MAFVPQTLINNSQAIHLPYRNVQASSSLSSHPISHRRHPSKQKFLSDLSQCLRDFVIQLLPTQEELAVKEDVRKLLERLIRTIEPHSRLLSFGSTANGFSLKNSDMDLCCLIDSEERLAASDLVTMLGDLLERETKFHVKPLPHARIPIVKLSLDPPPGLPLGIACDIGFENRLALENTRLLMCYAMVDPSRIRTMVLFLKVWSKRRKINSPYKGTLSSYGYVLLVIYFLVHVKSPPVLPNLQQMPPLRPISKEDTHLNGHNIWFFDDIDLLRQKWRSDNTESVAELLFDFFRYYSRDFPYNSGVASIRAGLLQKELKGWQNDFSGTRFNDARERNRLCIEDPFETDYNVGRCVTRDGLYTIRGEFMRAFRILFQRHERPLVALTDLCADRKTEELMSPPYSKPPTLPPQTPYTVGNQSLRPKLEERFSPPSQFLEPGRPSEVLQPVPIRSLPEHMAPKRSKWTSPPPPEAPAADHKHFENQLGMVLQLATSSTEAREKDTASETNSEGFTDEGSDAPDDDVKSVKSFTEGSPPAHSSPLRRPSWHTLETTRSPNMFNKNNVSTNSSSPSSFSSPRGRFTRSSDKVEDMPPASAVEHARRSSSGPPPRPINHHCLPSNSLGTPLVTPLPPSPVSTSSSPIVSTRFPFPPIDPANIYYQASPLATALRAVRHVQPSSLAQLRQNPSSPGGPSDSGSQHSSSSFPGNFQRSQTQDHTWPNSNRQMQSPSGRTDTIKAPVPRDIFPPSLTGLNFRSTGEPRTFSFGCPDTPTPATFHTNQQKQRLQSVDSRSSPSRPDPVNNETGISPRVSPLLSASTDNFQGRQNLVSTRQGIIQPTTNLFDQEHSDVHDSSSISTATTQNSGLDPLNANRARSPPAPSPGIESSQPDLVAAPSSQPAPAPSQSSRTSASSSSSPARSSTGGYSTGTSRSPSPPSSSTALPETLEIEKDERAGNKDIKMSGDIMRREEYGPIGLAASDSVSTIKGEGRGDGNGMAHARSLNQR